MIPITAEEGRRTTALISEGLCPVDRVRLVRDDQIRAGICPVCANAFWVRSVDGQILTGYFQVFKQVAHETGRVRPSPPPPGP